VSALVLPDSGMAARINSFDQWDVAPGEVAAATW